MRPSNDEGSVSEHSEQSGEDDPMDSQEDSGSGPSGAARHRGPPTYSNASSIPVPEDPPNSFVFRQFFRAICAFAEQCIGPNKESARPIKILKLICGRSSAAEYSAFLNGTNNTPGESCPLQRILHFAHACHATENSESLNQLVYYLNTFKFACLVQRFLNENPAYLPSDLFNKLVPLTTLNKEQMRNFLAHGVAAIRLAGAGSIYMLVFIASAKIKTELSSIDGPSIGVLARFIRCPTEDSALGRMIKHSLIPAVALLRKEHPVRMTVFFPVAFLQTLYVTDDVDCTNLHASDAILDSFGMFNDFIKARDWNSWRSCCDPVTSVPKPMDLLNTGFFTPINLSTALAVAPQNSSNIDASHAQTANTPGNLPTPPRDTSPPSAPDVEEPTPPDWNAPMQHEKLRTFKVNFKPRATYNTKVRFSSGKELRFLDTEEQRKLADRAPWAKDVEDFEKRLRKQLTSGQRPNLSTYLAFDTALLDGEMLRINNADGGILVMLICDMPEDLASPLPDRLDFALGGKFRVVDTKSEGSSNKFDALHIKHYAKFGKKGYGTPIYADPSTLQRDGRRPVNTSLNVPRFSQEAKDNPEICKMITEALQPAFDHIRVRLEQFFGQQFEELELFVNHLPNCGVSPVYPFAGYVLNINVSTRIHRDFGDKDICLILVICDCLGGEVVLVEPGIVLRVRNGDMIIFPSKDISHFNKHFIGRRASVVLHTDGQSKGWVEDANGWKDNRCFRWIRDADGDRIEEVFITSLNLIILSNYHVALFLSLKSDDGLTSYVFRTIQHTAFPVLASISCFLSLFIHPLAMPITTRNGAATANRGPQGESDVPAKRKNKPASKASQTRGKSNGPSTPRATKTTEDVMVNAQDYQAFLEFQNSRKTASGAQKAAQKAQKAQEDQAIQARNKAMLDQDDDQEEGSGSENDESGPPSKRAKTTPLVLSDDEEALASELRGSQNPAAGQVDIEMDDEDEQEREDEGGDKAKDQSDQEEEDNEDNNDDGAESNTTEQPTADTANNGAGPLDDNGLDVTSTENVLSATKKGAKKGNEAPNKSKRTTKPASKQGYKVVRDNFSSSAEILLLADRSKSHMRTKICFGDWVLDSDDKRVEWAWSIIKETPALLAPSASAIATRGLQIALKDEKLKQDLLTYVLYGKTVLFNTIITKARQHVAGYFQLTVGPLEEIKDRVTWLLTKSNFFYGDLDMKNRTFNKSKPFGCPLIRDMIQSLWFNASKNGSKAEAMTTRRMFENKEIPLSIVFLVVVAIEHSIGEYRDGKENTTPFRESQIRTRYIHESRTWKGLAKKSAKWADLYPKTAFKNIVQASGDLSRLLVDEDEANDEDIEDVASADLDNIADNEMDIF
ncbi:hypothetical protein CVT26_006107 [Gymnopilus dilepis]|uniref:DUF6532 domain-containing protein n=1 Tax=Gymnopilus dilepis TaxID=231916 RepID=A0A409YKG0_9AGAR|nr:hypothetical protein CVT26_006107 [Gymnopilus dilepis]